jgi:hypothetical protein
LAPCRLALDETAEKIENMHKSALITKFMRTTLDLDDQLLRQAKSLAAAERKSLTQLIEEGISLRVTKAARAAKGRAPVDLPIFHGQGGLLPGARKAKGYRELLDVMDQQANT